MAEITKYVVVNMADEWVSEQFDTKDEAITEAKELGLSEDSEPHAVLELTYEYSDSSLVWDPLGLDYWPPVPEDLQPTTYKIVRFYEDDTPTEVIETGLSLDEARAHCQREDTRGGEEGSRWFDGYEKEES